MTDFYYFSVYTWWGINVFGIRLAYFRTGVIIASIISVAINMQWCKFICC